jgi:glycosyltransferase involved in cell wall biosynthesis
MTSFSPGGTERQMTELIRRLDPARWTVHLACFHMRGAWFDRAAEGARSVVSFPVTSFRRPSVLREMWSFGRWCRDNRIVVVHTADMHANMFGLPGAALGGVPVRIGNRREINAARSLTEIAAQRAAYSCAHVIVANCRAAARRLMNEAVSARKVRVIPNGLDLESCLPRAIRSRPRRVIAVGNLRPEKGHVILVEAAADVLREFPDARFELAGGGSELGRLRARAEALGVSHAVSFVGHRDDVPARLSDADVFVLPSRSEAFPNAVLEAMGAGLPVIASRVGGVPELIEHERTGLLVPPGNPKALAEAICRVLVDPALGAELGRAARGAVLACFSFDRMVTAFDSIYRSELVRRGARQMRALPSAVA